MSEARTAILERIRSALRDVPPGEDASTDGVERAFHRRGEPGTPETVARFAERAAAYKVSVSECDSAGAGAAIHEILERRGHRRMVTAEDLPQAFVPHGCDVIVDHGLTFAEIAAADGVLTTCATAIAETGTIVLDHGEGQGRRALTLLPDYHLCIVETDRVVSLVPEAVARMEPSVKAGRPLTFISGPSATSDIELNRVEGVHGPRTLDVLIVRS
ncbi:L-lactate dehydrogenase complex protein LldG [Faunimonas pinastri]|uniref:L-lactate dehydrogenase complex protein LldG n=1 Tax=Faunimonas pinastri TaxID=1855383 RepID=A0A1H9NTS0_9HYPH|nr:LUD domain-containing protein [Faunimonas pinastri]SER39157.1 L-lactate dehydrogenase complex protein LldG [Faunimonas pinastri]